MSRCMLKRQAGFSLIELMVAVLLGLVLVMGTASFYSTLHTTSLIASQLGAAQESLQAVSMIVGRAVRQASTVSVLNNGKSMQVTYGNIQDADRVSSCLGNIRTNNNVDTFVFENGQLKCNDGIVNQNIVVALDIQDLWFSVSAGSPNIVTVVVKPTNLPSSYNNGVTLVFSMWQKYIQSRAGA